jgi:2'-5' RNA ligase
MPPERRLFVGIFPPSEIAELVHRAAREVLPPDVFRGVPADEIHLTLRFLGATPEAEIPGIRSFLAKAVRPLVRPRLRVLGSGAFPDERSARVLWAGIADPGDRLARLAAAVGESKPYTPHLTVARCRGVRVPKAFLMLDLDLPWTPDEVVLVESRPGSNGKDRFPRIEAFPLSAESA